MVRIRRGKRVSSKVARSRVLMLARHGNHSHLPVNTTYDIKKAFAENGYSFDSVVEEARRFGSTVPMFENLLGPNWTFRSSGGGSLSVSKAHQATGTQEIILEGSGEFISDLYWSAHDQMRKVLTRATGELSVAELITAAERGIASVEAYLGHRVQLWNLENPNDPLIDSKSSKVSFDCKIDVWIPRMTGGYKLDKSGKAWAAFRKIRTIRDDVSVHPKSSAHGVSHKAFVEQANLFQIGISGFLIDLHVLFSEKIPSTIIGEFFAPPFFLDEADSSASGR